MLQTAAPITVYTGLDGRPIDAGYIYFGLPNQNPETAPLEVYWDAAGTQPAYQPIRTINGYPSRNGTRANIYVGAEYSITVRDRNRALIVYLQSSRVFSGSSTQYVTNFSGTDTQAAQAALDMLLMTGGRIVFPAGRTYYITYGLLVHPNIDVVVEPGAIVNGSAILDGKIFLASGSEGSVYNLTTNSGPGNNTAQISGANLIASGIVVDDWVRLASDAVFDAFSTNSEVGELLQVSGINIGTGVISFWTKIQDNYLVADNAQVSKVTLSAGVSFSGGGRITGIDGIAGSCSAIAMFLCYRPKVENLSFDHFNGIGCWYQDCVQPFGDNLHFDHFMTDGVGYGIAYDNACQGGLFTNIFGNRVRHLYTTANSTSTRGIGRDSLMKGFVSINSARTNSGLGGDAVDTHTAAERIFFEDGFILSSTGLGLNLECASGGAKNVFIFDSANDGVAIHNESDRDGDFVLDNVHAVRSGLQGFKIQGGTRGGSPGWKKLMVNNVSSDVSNSAGFDATGVPAQFLKNCTFDNIVVRGANKTSGTDSLLVEYCDGYAASNFVSADSDSTAAICIRFRNTKNGTINGMRAKGPLNGTGIGVYVQANTAGSTDNVIIDQVVIDPGTYSSFDGLVVDNFVTNSHVGPNNRLTNANVGLVAGTSTNNRLTLAPVAVAYTIPSLVAGAKDFQLITVAGVLLKDILQVSCSVDLQGMVLTAAVSGANGVRVQVNNITGSTLNLGAVTLVFLAQRMGV